MVVPTTVKTKSSEDGKNYSAITLRTHCGCAYRRVSEVKLTWLKVHFYVIDRPAVLPPYKWALCACDCAYRRDSEDK